LRKTVPLLALLLTTAVAFGASINYGAAIERQRAHVAAEPQSAGAQNDLANLLVMVGEYEEAEQVYQSAMPFHAGDWRIYTGLADVYQASHQDELARLPRHAAQLDEA